MIRPDGTGDHLLLPDAAAGQAHPDWSPDGAQITFQMDNDLWVADVDGSHAARVFDCQTPCIEDEDPAWSPDGRSIAFVTAVDVNGTAPGSSVLAMDVATGALRTLYETVGPEYAWAVRWSPDGGSLVVVLNRYPDTRIDTSTVIASAIAVVDLGVAKATARVLTDWKMFAAYPDWSWATNTIVFTTFDLGSRDSGGFEDYSRPSDLYTIKPDGSGLTQLTHNPSGTTLVRNGTGSGPLSTQPSWTPDGTSIIFVQVEGTTWPGWGMATIAPDGTGLSPAAGSTFLLGTHPRLRPIP